VLTENNSLIIVLFDFDRSLKAHACVGFYYLNPNLVFNFKNNNAMA